MSAHRFLDSPDGQPQSQRSLDFSAPEAHSDAGTSDLSSEAILRSRGEIQPTSRAAWAMLQASGKLGEHQLECAEAFFALGGRAAGFEADEWWSRRAGGRLRYRIMQKRISELVDQDVLALASNTKINPATGRECNIYFLTGRKPKKRTKLEARMAVMARWERALRSIVAVGDPVAQKIAKRALEGDDSAPV